MTVKRSRQGHGILAQARPAGRQVPLHGVLPRHPRTGTLGGHVLQQEDANDAWKDAEAGVRAGRQGDPARGKQTFEAYVLDKWLPHHLLEPGVSSNYAGQIRKHLIPFFGPMKMRDIMPEHVREWVTRHEGQGRIRPDYRVLQAVDPQRHLHHGDGGPGDQPFTPATA